TAAEATGQYRGGSPRDVAGGQARNFNPLGGIYRAAGCPCRFWRLPPSRSTTRFFPTPQDAFTGRLQKLGLGRKLLDWQGGYGVVSFGTRDLEWVKAYVRNQKQHHAHGAVQDRLERITFPEEEAPVAEAEPGEAP